MTIDELHLPCLEYMVLMVFSYHWDTFWFPCMRHVVLRLPSLLWNTF